MADDWWCTLVCHDRDCRVSCSNPSIGGLAAGRQQPVQSNRTFQFLETESNRESIRINSLIESNWIDSNRKLESSNCQQRANHIAYQFSLFSTIVYAVCACGPRLSVPRELVSTDTAVRDDETVELGKKDLLSLGSRSVILTHRC